MFQQPYFQLSYPENVKPQILSKKSNCEFDKSVFHAMDEKIEEFREKMKSNQELQDFLKKKDEIKIEGMHYIFNIFNFYDENSKAYNDVPVGGIKLVLDEYNNPEKCCRMIELKVSSNWKKTNYVKKKFKKVFSTMVGDEIYQSKLLGKSYCERSSIVRQIRLNLLYTLFDVLEKGGDVLLAHIYNICDCDIIEFMYLCGILFEKVIIMNFGDFFVYGSNFLFDNRMTKEEFKEKIFQKTFTIEPKVEYDEMIKYLQQSAKERIRLTDMLLNKQYDEYMYLYYLDMIQKGENMKLSKVMKHKLQQKLIEIFRNVFINNKLVRIHSAIKGEEGRSIQQLLKKYNCKKCIEVGMAFGISAFYILSTSPDINLISIDPTQSTQWEGSAVKLLKKMDLDKNHELMEKKSYVALPELMEKYGEGSFDFIFIDGWHTFDFTLVDAFYASLLVKVGGVILIDDALHSGVAKCVRYLDTNYTFLKRISSTKTQAGYLKIKNDDREWNFHRPF